jgi:hypothetical protein
MSKKDIPNPQCFEISYNSVKDARNYEVEATLSPLSLGSATVIGVGKNISFLKLLYLNVEITAWWSLLYFDDILHHKCFVRSGHNVDHVKCHEVPSTCSVNVDRHTDIAIKVIQCFLAK